jgi:hypothetical protein
MTCARGLATLPAAHTPGTKPSLEPLPPLAYAFRVPLDDLVVVLGPGEVAEFDTRIPHRFGGANRLGLSRSAISASQPPGHEAARP